MPIPSINEVFTEAHSNNNNDPKEKSKKKFRTISMQPNCIDTINSLEYITGFCYFNMLVWMLHEIDQNNAMTIKRINMFKKALAKSILFSYGLFEVDKSFLYTNLQLFRAIENSDIGPNVEMEEIKFRIEKALDSLKLVKLLNEDAFRIYSHYFEANTGNIRKETNDFVNIHHSHCVKLCDEYVTGYNVLTFIDVLENTNPWKLEHTDNLPFYGIQALGHHNFKNLGAIQNMVDNIPDNNEKEVLSTIKTEVLVNMKVYFTNIIKVLKYLGQTTSEVKKYNQNDITELYVKNFSNTYDLILSFTKNLITNIKELKDDLAQFLRDFISEEKEIFGNIYSLIHGKNKQGDLLKHGKIEHWIKHNFQSDVNSVIKNKPVTDSSEGIEHSLRFDFSIITTPSLVIKKNQPYDYEKCIKQFFMERFDTINTLMKRLSYPHYVLKNISKTKGFVYQEDTEEFVNLKKLIVINPIEPLQYSLY